MPAAQKLNQAQTAALPGCCVEELGSSHQPAGCQLLSLPYSGPHSPTQQLAHAQPATLARPTTAVDSCQFPSRAAGVRGHLPTLLSHPLLCAPEAEPEQCPMVVKKGPAMEFLRMVATLREHGKVPRGGWLPLAGGGPSTSGRMEGIPTESHYTGCEF